MAPELGAILVVVIPARVFYDEITCASQMKMPYFTGVAMLIRALAFITSTVGRMQLTSNVHGILFCRYSDCVLISLNDGVEKSLHLA
ncbi:hypothetical protein LU604_12500 [Erwinia tracheiphila]|uniref:hypothetical protein n=1 Tax=Erwinia tracheiphila TaxID=65700 RepID=UPI001F2DD66B|nr:hypothetical protein [Erwinia tracheiphila]UIA85508.1 hypothetical protein LU604_12500 [Erwinia tracheiphila]